MVKGGLPTINRKEPEGFYCDVREKRDLLGISQSKLARMTKINKGKISLIERGIYVPTIVEWKALAKALGPIQMSVTCDIPPREGK